MLSVRDIQKKTIDYFSGKGVPNPKLDTDLLIAHVLGLKRLELYLDIDRPLSEAELSELRPLVKRRANREPLQYILGTSEFCGMPLKVDARALIPRPETEELVEHLRERMAKPPATILDLGTGSGAIAIALAAMYPDAEVWATDQSEAALQLARDNAESFVSGNRIHFLQGSWWDALPAGLTFDLIVSNPPYLTEAEMHTAEPEVAANEPQAALVAGPDGLNALKQIIAGAKKHLAPGGLLALETGIAQHGDLDKLATQVGLQAQGLSDMSGLPRFYFATTGATKPVEAPLADASIPENKQRASRSSSDPNWHAQAQPLQEKSSSGRTASSAEAPLLSRRSPAKPDADASPPQVRPNAASQLRRGRISKPDARYFITCCTQDRQADLESEACAVPILTALNELHTETSIDLLSATVMPDHVHVLLRLGRRLELSQVVAKFKALTRHALAENGLDWQKNYYDHRLRADDASEKFSKYIFLNPYRANLVPLDETWPWWVLSENYRPEFLAQLEDPPLPPEAWLGESAELAELVDEDR